MKSSYNLIKLFNGLTKKFCLGVTHKIKRVGVEVGKDRAMNLNVDIRLSEEQLKQIEEQAKIEVTKAMVNGTLDTYIKEVIKSCIKTVVNEEIQTKNYRKLISDRVTKIVMEDGISD